MNLVRRAAAHPVAQVASRLLVFVLRTVLTAIVDALINDRFRVGGI